LKAFVLCGGFGTRLRSVIGDAQKAVTEVDGKPFLAHVIDELVAAGVSDLVFCTHFQSEQVEQAIAGMSQFAAPSLRIVRESVPLGTAGAVVNAIREIGYQGPLMVLNADTFVSSGGYLAALQASSPAILVTPVADCARYGAIRVDYSDRVLGLVEKGVTGPGLISAGVVLLDTQDFEGYGIGPLSMEKDIIPQLISQNRLTAARYHGPFVDIGTPESLQQIRMSGVQGIQ
jgi:NDP-sugar pyrophosphorylase family protein